MVSIIKALKTDEQPFIGGGNNIIRDITRDRQSAVPNTNKTCFLASTDNKITENEVRVWLRAVGAGNVSRHPNLKDWACAS